MALGSLLVKNFFDNVPVSLDEAGILADHELRRFHRDPALFRARRLGRSQGLTATSWPQHQRQPDRGGGTAIGPGAAAHVVT
jgi:hypothetical protein